MEEKFLKVAQEGHFFDKHSSVLVAVSGGKDSMALLYLLYKYREKLQIHLAVAHVNHKQRIQSDEEESYLKKWTKERDIPFYVDYFKGAFTEEAARKMRYGFFQRVMEQHHYSALVTAHHADDQAETIFMRFIRGSRLFHLSGIQAIQPFAGGELIRPLLSFKTSELLAFHHFEDESNASSRYFRNRVRKDYLPLLTKENPQLSSALCQLGQEVNLLYQAFQDMTQAIDVTNVQEFQKQTPAVQYYLLYSYLEHFPDLQLSKSQFDDLLTILRTKANYYHRVKGDYYLVKDYTSFSITKIGPKTDRQMDEYMIESEGIFQYGSFLFSLNTPLADADHILYLQKDEPIMLRGRKKGDTILLHSIQKKLRRYFIDEKVPQKTRDEAVIIEQAGKIYGIANIVTSDLSKSLKNDIIKAILYIKMKE